jgi:hypothetical protein
MNRGGRLLFVLALALIIVTATGTHGATTVALDRTADVDIVDQSAGLLAVSQTPTGFNATTNTANLTITVTNQLTLPIERVDVTVEYTTRTTGHVSPGGRADVSFTDVDCATTVVIEYDTGALEQRIERPILCR